MNSYEPGYNFTPQVSPWPEVTPATAANRDPTDNQDAQLAASPYQLPQNLLPMASGNLSAALQGQIPQGDVDFLRTKAAEFGVGSGTVGSELAGNQGLRSLGLMSLSQSNQATKDLLPFFNNPMQYANLARRQVTPGSPAAPGQRSYPVSSPIAGGGGGRLIPMTDPATGRQYMQAVGAGIGTDLVNAYGPSASGRTGTGTAPYNPFAPQGGQAPASGGGAPWWADANNLNDLTPEELWSYAQQNPDYAMLSTSDLAEMTPEERGDLVSGVEGQGYSIAGNQPVSSGNMYIGPNPTSDYAYDPLMSDEEASAYVGGT